MTVGYIVFNCGCTDCFPNAAFHDLDRAQDWAKKNCKNPEGYFIKECKTNEEFLYEWSNI